MVFGAPPGSHEICPVCFWEDDAAELEFATSTIGGANGISLAAAQANFAEYGASEARVLAYVRPPAADEPRDPLWRPVDPSRDRFPDPRDEDAPRTPDRSLYYWRATSARSEASRPAS
jgi:hypothetical protein